jgi:formate dehydrogenase subunit gamma
MTPMPTWAGRMATDTVGQPTRAGRVVRFTLTERLLHLVVVISFFAMLGTGLALYFSGLAQYITRPTAKSIHLWAAIVMFASAFVIPLLGNRRAVARSMEEVQHFDVDDAAWISGGLHRLTSDTPAPPQGRFNAGQKLNTTISAGLLVVLGFTGLLLWLGERNTSWRFAGSVPMHDLAALLVTVLVAGHMYLALINPSTRHALRGMVQGDVDRDWAAHHHASWVEPRENVDGGPHT